QRLDLLLLALFQTVCLSTLRSLSDRFCPLSLLYHILGNFVEYVLSAGAITGHGGGYWMVCYIVAQSSVRALPGLGPISASLYDSGTVLIIARCATPLSLCSYLATLCPLYKNLILF